MELLTTPEEEFFRLSLLSVKIRYEELDFDFEFPFTAKKLFKRCTKEDVPF